MRNVSAQVSVFELWANVSDVTVSLVSVVNGAGRGLIENTGGTVAGRDVLTVSLGCARRVNTLEATVVSVEEKRTVVPRLCGGTISSSEVASRVQANISGSTVVGDIGTLSCSSVGDASARIVVTLLAEIGTSGVTSVPNSRLGSCWTSNAWQASVVKTSISERVTDNVLVDATRSALGLVPNTTSVCSSFVLRANGSLVACSGAGNAIVSVARGLSSRKRARVGGTVVALVGSIGEF